MKRIENVSIDEIIWRTLSGHFGSEFEKQRKEIEDYNSSYLIQSPFDNDREMNRIRLGCLTLCAGANNPITNLILRNGPKSNNNQNLKFSRYFIHANEFCNFYEINYNKKLKNATKKYLNNNKVNALLESFDKGSINLDSLNNIILYKIKSKYIIIDGVHRAMAMTYKGLRPDTIICLDNEIKYERIFYKKRLVIK